MNQEEREELKKEIQELFDSVPEEQKEGLQKEVEKLSKELPVVTYKQLAQNFKDLTSKQCSEEIRKVIERMNKDKKKLNVVNRPGTVLNDATGSYMIMKNGKSMFLGGGK